MINSRTEGIIKIGIFIYFITFLLIYVFSVPVFEAPDENLHLDYINYISKYKDLPNQYSDYKTEKFVGQGHQPPFYYIMTGLFNYIVNSDGTTDVTPIPNKLHIWNGGKTGFVPLYNHNAGNFFKSENDGTVFYLLRVFSVILSTINLYFILRISSIFFEGYLRLLPVIIAATLPQFQFISGMVNSDNLANLLSTVCIFYILKILKQPEDVKNFIYTGIMLGLGLITKKTLFFLVPGIIVLLFYVTFKHRENAKSIIRNSVLLIIFTFIISTIYFARNYILYGGFLGSQMEIDTMGYLVEKKSLLSVYFIKQFPLELTRSFHGVFGWMNVPLPKYIYIFNGILTLMLTAGILFYIKRIKFRNVNFNFSILLIILCLTGLVYFNLTFTQYQGRYIFPVLSLIAVLFSTGLKEIISYFKSDKTRKIVISLLITGFIAIDIISILTIHWFYYNPINYL